MLGYWECCSGSGRWGLLKGRQSYNKIQLKTFRCSEENKRAVKASKSEQQAVGSELLL